MFTFTPSQLIHQGMTDYPIFLSDEAPCELSEYHQHSHHCFYFIYGGFHPWNKVGLTFMHIPLRQPVCVHCYYWHLEPRLTQLTTTMINFLQGLPHLLVCSMQLSAYQIPPQHLYSRCGRHCPSFNPSLLPHWGSTHHGHYSILPSLSDEAQWVWG